MVERGKSEWLCISCGVSLGSVQGGEYYPTAKAVNVHTSGPNLVVSCSECGSLKTWYTADPVVRAIYQLVHAMADVSARAMLDQVGKEIHSRKT